MKAILSLLTALVLCSSAAFGDTYTGTVSEIKHFSKGGVAVDMDGMYPNQKMVLYVGASDTKVTKLPAVGDRVTATGEVAPYKGHPEMKIHSDDQWKW